MVIHYNHWETYKLAVLCRTQKHRTKFIVKVTLRTSSWQLLLECYALNTTTWNWKRQQINHNAIAFFSNMFLLNSFLFLTNIMHKRWWLWIQLWLLSYVFKATKFNWRQFFFYIVEWNFTHDKLSHSSFVHGK